MSSSGSRPASYPLGKRIVAGGSSTNRNYGDELARRGYVVPPDYPSLVTRKIILRDGQLRLRKHESYRQSPQGNVVLTQIPEVDPRELSDRPLGGHNAIFLGAFDERIQCVVSSCGWDPFPYYYGGRLAGWASER